MIQLPPVFGSFLNAVRSFERAADPKLNVKIDPRLAKFQQPVQNVEKLRKQRADGFDHSDADAAQQPAKTKNPARFANLDLGGSFRSSNPSANLTPDPRRGATDVTNFLRNDGFEGASRKLVELSPKPPPSFKPAVPVFRFR